MYFGDPPILCKKGWIEPCIFVCSYNAANVGTISFSWFFYFSVVRCMWKSHSFYTTLNHDSITVYMLLLLYVQFSL